LLVALALGAAAALALGEALSLRGGDGPSPAPVPAGERLLIQSRPPGATVAIDGEDLPACSPCEVRVRPGQVVHLRVTTLRYNRERSWSGPVSDARAVSVDLTDTEPHVVIEPRVPAAQGARAQVL
ncbi:MAG: PEGA domain-containing protein, partial [Myxococcaceae bacterium]|nr:PEGA domain-containing protein [Myxococcaceae bacterium]